MEYYLIPINETSFKFGDERFKDLLYEKYPNIGELEVKFTSKILLKDKPKKKEKIQVKSDIKETKIFDKLNIPKYIIVYKYTDGELYESETSIRVFTNNLEKLKKYACEFSEAYDYFLNTDYYNKLMNFFKKDISLEITPVKEKPKTKKKTKNIS